MIPSDQQPLVSVIMPAFNTGAFIADAITSVIAQTWTNWELIVVDDGSTDSSFEIARSFEDPRIHVRRKSNGGIGSARNRGLDIARGELICFLDSDDTMPVNSIVARAEVLLKEPALSFADGSVHYYDREMRNVHRTYTPSFVGEPLPLLLRFDRRCFFGNTWMIRREAIGDARFPENVTHVEDLMLYLKVAHGRLYGATSEPVLNYRITGQSSMTQLGGLERSYHEAIRWMARHKDIVPRRAVWYARYKVRRMMSGAYWHSGEPLKAILAWLR
jgi:glycosyltransferase involved in cell wall biosynthesis